MPRHPSGRALHQPTGEHASCVQMLTTWSLATHQLHVWSDYTTCVDSRPDLDGRQARQQSGGGTASRFVPPGDRGRVDQLLQRWGMQRV